MKRMTCYRCKGKGHVSGDVCEVCGGLGHLPVPAEPIPPPDPEDDVRAGEAHAEERGQ